MTNQTHKMSQSIRKCMKIKNHNKTIKNSNLINNMLKIQQIKYSQLSIKSQRIKDIWEIS